MRQNKLAASRGVSQRLGNSPVARFEYRALFTATLLTRDRHMTRMKAERGRDVPK